LPFKISRRARKYAAVIIVILLAIPILVLAAQTNNRQKMQAPPPPPARPANFSDKLPAVSKYKYLPDSCAKSLASTQCQTDIQAFLGQNCSGSIDNPNCTEAKTELFNAFAQKPCSKDKNSPMCACLKGADFDTPICESALKEALFEALQQDCPTSPDSIYCACASDPAPGKCLGKKIGGNLVQKAACPIKIALDYALGFDAPLEGADCTGYLAQSPLTASKSSPLTSTDRCADNPYLPSCKTSCEEQAYSGYLDYGCSQYYKAYCTTIDYSAQGCRQIIYQEFPGVADFCARFPKIRLCQELGL